MTTRTTTPSGTPSGTTTSRWRRSARRTGVPVRHRHGGRLEVHVAMAGLGLGVMAPRQ